jgi:membrane peptidoglycan carboxypeptidase
MSPSSPRAATAAPPRSPWWRRTLRWVGAIVAGLVVAGLAAFAVLWFTIDVPAPNDFATSETTIVYYADGTNEIGRFSTENRVSVPLLDVPEHVQQAVLAAEDRTFYENRGISVPGIVRAAWNNLTTGSTQGGSTITQQYVKNYYLTLDQTYWRKIEEIILALKIDATLSKDQILEDYLNTVYFGRGAYGIQTGGQAWFRTDVQDLSVSQGATLAAVLQSPTSLDPRSGDEAKQALANRFDYVIDGMVDEGWLSEQEAAEQSLPKSSKPPSGNALGGTNGYVLATVRDELLAVGFTGEEIDSGGLRVVSTFDRKAQRAVRDAVEAEFPTVDAEGVRVGIAAVEPGTGALRAMYGGEDYVERSINNATQSYIPGASTFKAFALAAGLEDGVSLQSRFQGNSPYLIEGDTNPATNTVRNEGGRSYGELVDLQYATAQSINTAFVDLTMTVGPDAVMDAALRAGLPDTYPDGTSNGLLPNARITLGTAAVSPLQMAESYATLAAEGMHADPHTVASVSDRDGALRYEHETSRERRLEADVTADVTSALQSVVTSGTGTAAQALGRPAAGKTGTAGPEGVTQSSWYVGYTPQLATAVGYFRGEGTVTDDLDGAGGLPTFFGGAYPARTWTTFMTGALDGEAVEQFPPASGIGTVLSPPPPPPPVAPPPPPTTDAPREQPQPTPEPPPSPQPTPQPTAPPEPPPSPQPTPEPQPTPPPRGGGDEDGDEDGDAETGAGAGEQQAGSGGTSSPGPGGRTAPATSAG